MKHVFILGYGYMGRLIAESLVGQGLRVTAVARNADKQWENAKGNPTFIRADLDEATTLGGLPLNDSIVFYLAPPSDSNDQDLRVRNLVQAMDRQRPARLIYFSTTGVYGNCDGSWVTEQTPTQPDTPRGRRRLDAEQVLSAWAQRERFPCLIFRVPGIYGPNRLPFATIQSGKPILRAELAPFSNRIHALDLAALAVAAAESGEAGVYNVSDGNPGTMTDYFLEVARAAGLPQPPQVDWQQAEAALSPAMLSYLHESRRIDSSKLRRVFPGIIQFSDWRAGVAQAVAASEKTMRGS